ncbi:MAG: GLPGLI family protein [Dysgonamonadaceae bacterium]|jgi:GLPGLI family protein|nr:GLPGLI family protein [Dysgonamonadaceae bacterium]
MKRLFSFMAICLFPLFAYSQLAGLPKGFETLDTTAIRVFYDYNYPSEFSMPKRLASISVEDSIKYENAKDYMVLEIGTTGISKFYSDHKRQMDSLITEVMKNPQKAQFMMEDIQKFGLQKAASGEIFKNYPAGKMTVTDNFNMINAFSYEDALNDIDWEITSDTMTCLNYLCQKATADFRGRHYEVWFAPDIPVNDGPWKFSGLPGLILYAKDSENKYILKAVALDNTRAPLQFAKRDYMKITRKELDKIKTRFAADPIGFALNAFPGADVKLPDKFPDGKGGMVSREDLKSTYHPMELE